MAIGSVGVSGVGPEQIQPAALGAGTAQAISGIAGALSQTVGTGMDQAAAEHALTLAHGENQDKFTRATLQMNLLKTNAELGRQLTDLAAKQPPGAPALTDQTKIITDKVYGDFLATVPEKMKPEFIAAVEAEKQAKVTGAFTYQNAARDDAYKGYAADLALHAMQEINSQHGTLATWQPVIDSFLKNSPLSAADTKTLSDNLNENLQKVEYARVRTDFAKNPSANVGTWGGPTDGTDIVAAGVPGPIRAFLNFTASGEAHGYDVTNGGGKISSYADHPGPVAPGAGHSSAAGRYQFLAGTWAEAKAALHLPDFSPESQDRAAIWLASRDYRRKTGGDLQLDLASGDVNKFDSIVKSLSTTWTSFAGKTGADLAAYMGVAGTPDHISSDPQYDRLDPFTKAQLDNSAQAQANSDLVDAQRAATARMNAVTASIQSVAVKGDFANARSLTQQAFDTEKIPAEKVVQLQDFIDKEQKRSDNANLMTNLASGKTVYDSTDPAMKASYDDWYHKIGAAALSSQDQNAFFTQVLPVVKMTGATPGGMDAAFKSMIVSNDPKTAQFALDALLAMRDSAPAAFRSLPPEVYSQATYYGFAKNTVPLDQVLNTVRGINDPAMKPQRDYQVAAGMRYVNDPNTAANFALPNLASQVAAVSAEGFMGGTTTFTSINTGAPGSLRVEKPEELNAMVMSFYNENLSKYTTPEQALSAAITQTQQQWGVSKITGTPTLMRWAPEMLYPADSTGTHDYMRSQLISDLNLPTNSYAILSADQRTGAEAADKTPGRPGPSFSVMILSANGGLVPATVLTDPNNPSSETSARIVFDPSALDKQRVAKAKADVAGKIETQTRLRNEIAATSTRSIASILADPKNDPVKTEYLKGLLAKWDAATAANNPDRALIIADEVKSMFGVTLNKETR